MARDVAYGPRNMGLGEEEIQRRVDTALGLVGLPPQQFGEKSPFSLSGGERRRTVILNPRLNWSEEEINRALERLNALPDQSLPREEDLLLLSRAERLFAELTDSRREEAADIILRLTQALQSGSSIRLAQERENLLLHLEELEAWAQRDIWEPPSRDEYDDEDEEEI